MKQFGFCRKVILAAAGIGSLGVAVLPGHAATVWSADLNFTEFEGLPGGFDNDSPQPVLIANRGTAGTVQGAYDVLKPVGTDPASGMATYAEGQDGVTDVTFRTRLIDGTQGAWDSFEALKRRNTYMGNIVVTSGRSFSGAYGVVAMEVTLNHNLHVTADQLGLRLASVNGLGEIYEWTMVTVGGLDDAPFDVAKLSQYNALTYSDLSGSTYYNADGTVKTGGVASDQPMQAGQSISQFLRGEPASPRVSGPVAPGWYAFDERNAIILDGPETAYTNPGSLGGSLYEKTVTGADLGLSDSAQVDRLTIWFGFYDVAFDSNGDGFTTTNSQQDAWISRLSIGTAATVPEPAVLLFSGTAVCAAVMRRRRSASTAV